MPIPFLFAIPILDWDLSTEDPLDIAEAESKDGLYGTDANRRTSACGALTAYHATEAETPRTGSGMADQEQKRVEHATPNSSFAPTASSQSCPVEGLHPFSAHIRSTTAWYALCSILQKKRIKPKKHRPMDDRGSGTNIARRMYDIADQGPYKFLRSIAPMHERSPSGRPLPRELLKTLPPTQG
ncbi:hypothetical protein EVAR_39821_1 [Eumeta japonica]|uniref:Uncharacterized protein n=1 Tax=Eumeta variegata TaxID=151549 RepID=A0A4C1XB80_EUMVA|nr:hypothetical protein EVAR_39821_1 [Eumeta japonica]